jgi:hypothetical protein
MPPLMLTDDEALAVLLRLVAGRRAGLVTTSVAAAESAAAKVQRVLPEALGRRLDALLQTTDFTVGSRPVIELETTVLLVLAEAARGCRPVAMSYTSPNGRRSERTVHPYGIVAHSGRWYVTGADSASGETRTFRLDRITTPQLQAGTLDSPTDSTPPRARALRVRRGASPTRGLATGLGHSRAGPVPAPDGNRHRARHRRRRRLGPSAAAGRAVGLGPAVLAGLGLPFAVEHPEALRGLVRSLAERLTAAAAADTSHR